MAHSDPRVFQHLRFLLYFGKSSNTPFLATYLILYFMLENDLEVICAYHLTILRPGHHRTIWNRKCTFQLIILDWQWQTSCLQITITKTIITIIQLYYQKQAMTNVMLQRSRLQKVVRGKSQSYHLIQFWYCDTLLHMCTYPHDTIIAITIIVHVYLSCHMIQFYTFHFFIV